MIYCYWWSLFGLSVKCKTLDRPLIQSLSWSWWRTSNGCFLSWSPPSWARVQVWNIFIASPTQHQVWMSSRSFQVNAAVHMYIISVSVVARRVKNMQRCRTVQSWGGRGVITLTFRPACSGAPVLSFSGQQNWVNMKKLWRVSTSLMKGRHRLYQIVIVLLWWY